MITEIWNSFRNLPLWVQIWVVFILVPVNLLSLGFLGQPGALCVAVLANGGMVLNLPILLRDRGFSKAMALPHVLLWTPLVLLLAVLLRDPALLPAFATYLWVLLVVDVVSLAFDYVDAVKWLRGARDVA